MPTPEFEPLDPHSAEAQVKAVMAACIAVEIRNGRDPEQAKVICYEKIRRHIEKAQARQEQQDVKNKQSSSHNQT